MKTLSSACPAFVAATLMAATLLAGCFGSPAPGLDTRREWVNTHPAASAQIKRAVFAKKLLVGMTMDAISASWGEPDDTMSLGGSDERWTYIRRQALNNTSVKVEYLLIFRGGVLARIHKQRYR